MDEARHTEHDHQGFSEANLRHLGIDFVSAIHSSAEDLNQTLEKETGKDSEPSGYTTSFLGVTLMEGNHRDYTNNKGDQSAVQSYGDIDTDITSDRFSASKQMANMSLIETSGQSFATFNANDSMIPKTLEASKSNKDREGKFAANQVFFTDVSGSQTLKPTSRPSQLENSTPLEDSDIGEEEIMFTGRNPRSKPIKSFPLGSEARANDSLAYASSKMTEKVPYDYASTTIEDSRSNWIPSSTANDAGLKTFVQEVCISSAKAPQCGLPYACRSRKQLRKAPEEGGILDDYIANICAHGVKDDCHIPPDMSSRDLGGITRPPSEVDILLLDQDRIKSGEEWSSADIQDFDDFSTSSEEFEAVDTVLAKRERPSGTQYLVIGDGLKVDEARWLPSNLLRMSENAASLVQIFDSEQAQIQHMLVCNGSNNAFTDEAQADSDTKWELEETIDYEGLEARRKAHMTDEQIARLFSKQEVHGIGSADPFFLGEGESGSLAEARYDHLDVGLSSRKKKSQGKKQAKKVSSPAIAFSKVLEDDQDEGNDTVDRKRRSLRRKTKGPRSPLNLEVSDSELESRLQTAWEKDRSKKKARKQEREELRSQGLLGVKTKDKNKPRLKAKYPDGLGVAQLKEEIRQFLSSSAQELALPPMDANARKNVHEVCHKLALKTHSLGSGTSRYPVVYKTSRSGSFDEEAFAFVYRKFLPRPGKGKKMFTSVAGRRGAALASFSYRDGEVVGAAAPELGQENRGRAMLEKMGWSNGTALGAPNNKGIPVPVAQIVKTTRAGLG